ncbi:MAG: (p)ppGpp synthetase [Dictyoglomus sp. NZ13-RE01]|nr:MAG: (p)ppGpp synthetase [Dictyoglomus sp. NZ13-RE01]
MAVEKLINIEEELFRELINKISDTNKYSIENLEKAFRFAQKAHAGQFRKSGDPYIIHPLEVAKILIDLGMDENSVIAGLLHDVLEDTDVTPETIEKEFNSDVLSLVESVTKLEKLNFYPKEFPADFYRAKNIKKMFLSIANDVRVVIIKLADRLHNMRTLEFHDPEKQKRIAKETLEIYAPLAHRLGVWEIKWQLEDLAFKFLEPEKYREIARKVTETRKEREESVQKAIEKIKKALEEANIKAEVTGRAKHLYSIYQKMEKKNIDIEEMYDLLGIRIIVNEVKECYEVLGIVHNIWVPIPGRFKDYIANKKSNNYQSLHTTVIGENGKPLEIQIRTWEMHRIAEYGVAAHWRYKEDMKQIDYFELKLSWLRQILEWQKDLPSDVFVELVKNDLFGKEIYVFTPKGEIISLPQGSTPIDFAYAIHTEIGHRCKQAKVNGKIVPLDYVLQNGDIVEIITSKEEGKPSRDWLNIVKTSQAKTKIKQYFKKLLREERIEEGKKALEEELKRNEDWVKKLLNKKENISLNELLESEYLKNILQELGFKEKDVSSFLAAVGSGEITPQKIFDRLRREYQEERTIIIPPKTPSKILDINVDGLDNLMIRLAECCKPIPGDKVLGYISKGKGIVIHREDCPNIKNLRKKFPERIVEVSMERTLRGPFKVGLEIDAIDRVGLLRDITDKISQAKINIIDLSTKVKDGIAHIKVVVEIDNDTIFKYLMEEISQLSDIINVRRMVKI